MCEPFLTSDHVSPPSLERYVLILSFFDLSSSLPTFPIPIITPTADS
jgi:hypothetical protein